MPPFWAANFFGGRYRTRTVINATVRWTVAVTSANTGERSERRRGREKRGERVAAVCVQRRRIVAKAHTGRRNRGLQYFFRHAEKCTSSPISNHSPSAKTIFSPKHKKSLKFLENPRKSCKNALTFLLTNAKIVQPH